MLPLILFCISIIFLLDFYFIGFLPYLLGSHNRYNDLDNVLYEINVGRVTSDCFTSDGSVQLIRGYFTQVDSKMTVTDTYLYIGKKILSYHYRLLLTDIVSINSVMVNSFTYRILIKLKSNNSYCFIEMSSFILSKTKKDMFNKFVSNIQLVVDN